MSVIRLPSWSEVLHPGAPWAYHLRSGGAGLWLMRGEAEEVDGLDVRVVAGSACPTWAELWSELALALETDTPQPSNTVLLDRGAAALAVLVTDAERVLEHEPSRLAELLESLHAAARERTLRVIFQARELPDTTLSLFREYEVATIG